ncbi:MAG: primosomal protein N' [Treponema sp.]|nr:primosomal protein N' [Treponema sp.]
MIEFIDVALNVPLNQPFTYRVPPESTEGNFFGRRVEVRFGNRKMTGIVVSEHEAFPKDCGVTEDKIRPAVRFLDDESVFTRELYDTARWMSRYYLCPIGEAVTGMVPSGKRETDSSGFSFVGDESSFEKKSLSDEQIAAVEGITRSTDGKMFHYLYGKTGSGKTEVFLSCADEILKNGRGVIYLVPEIGLTPQVVESVVKRFGDTAAVLHSGLTPSQRLTEWNRILRREARIVVGARSAVFAPVPDLGMVIIDEEHDGSYKAGNSPRYHARQVAMYRCTKLGIPLVMGSATPSLEAWQSMSDGTIVRHTLTRRLSGGAMPKIECVDLNLSGNRESSLSTTLVKKMGETLSQKRQVILFLNRRGFTHFFRCSSCGFEMKCKNCSVSMTYHKSENRLRCHYCGYSVQPPQQCPKCSSLDVGYSGFGTEYIEAEVKAKFPNEKIVRVDTDSVTHKGELKQKIDDFRDGKYSILLGTQMVAKGLNFPNLKLVGIVLADTALHLPDFRAAERTFSLITQVSGRAGRFFPDGEVVVQSYTPELPPIDFAVKDNLEDFYDEEIKQRRLLNFPPFSRLLRLVFRSQVPGAAEDAANGAAEILHKHLEPGVEIMGPVECPIEMVAGNWRHHILLRGKSIAPMQKMADILVNGYTAPKHVHIEVDVDPVTIL